MSEQLKDALDGLAAGPEASDTAAGGVREGSADPSSHPSVPALRERFGSAILHHEVVAGDEHVIYIPADRVVEILGWLKTAPGHDYDLLKDLTAVDYGGGRPLQVVHQLWSIRLRHEIRVKAELPLQALEIDSLTSLWATADWLEREVFDLFGITFRGHPDLRRIMMPDNYTEGHPLRKDFPLRGRLSRLEQTRLALAQSLERDYTPEELEIGGKPVHAGPRGGETAARP
jgi:NADH-quinone oxidoreductase subunit C